MRQLIYYKLGQILLHRGACITKKAALLPTGTSITNWSKCYYKVGLVIQYKVRQLLLQSMVGIMSKVTLLQSGATIIEKTSTSS